MPEVFKRTALDFGGSLAADQGIMTFAGSAAGLTPILMQNVSLRFAQQVTRLYEVSDGVTPPSVYEVGGRASGALEMAHIIGPRAVLGPFYARYSDICNTRDNLIQLGFATTCGNDRTTLDYLLKFCTLTQIGVTSSAQDLLVAANAQLTFVILEHAGGGGFEVAPAVAALKNLLIQAIGGQPVVGAIHQLLDDIVAQFGAAAAQSVLEIVAGFGNLGDALVNLLVGLGPDITPPKLLNVIQPILPNAPPPTPTPVVPQAKQVAFANAVGQLADDIEDYVNTSNFAGGPNLDSILVTRAQLIREHYHDVKVRNPHFGGSLLALARDQSLTASQAGAALYRELRETGYTIPNADYLASVIDSVRKIDQEVLF